MATAYKTPCPNCGAENDSNDLFCKDCGSSLVSVSNTAQHTAAFTPLNASNETQTTTIAPSMTPPPVTYSAEPPAMQPSAYSYHSEPESARGAVLGWLAAALMVIIVAAFVWSTVISDATRDRITGIF